MISELSGAHSKADFRGYLKERLRLFVGTSGVKSTAEARIVSNVSSLLNKQTGLVAGYSSLLDEPNLSCFYSTTNQPLAFPRVGTSEMLFLSIDNYAQQKWDVSPLGFKYPSTGIAVSADQINVILVPGLGFSAFGERLGRGKGFYDQYLANFKGLKVGVCFDCQWTDGHLPFDDWDIKMNFIITESKCVEIKD